MVMRETRQEVLHVTVRLSGTVHLVISVFIDTEVITCKTHFTTNDCVQ